MRKWRERGNGERMRKWRQRCGNEERERERAREENEERERFPPFLSISSLCIVINTLR